jgi:sialate O-acetylesterase
VINSRLSPFLTLWQDTIARYPANFSRYEQNLKRWDESGGKAGRPAPPMGPGHPHEPTSLYNGMIAPIVKYTIKGALWYQGETEASRAQGGIYDEARQLRQRGQEWSL